MAFNTRTNSINTMGTRNDKYDVESLTFPSELLGNISDQPGQSDQGNQFAGSWVMFNINVQQNAKAATSEPVVNLDANEAAKAKQVNSAQRANPISPEQAGATMIAGGAIVGAGSQFSLEGLLGGGQQAKKTGTAMLKGGLVGGAVGAASAAPYKLAGTANRATKRLKTAIQLPMPNEFLNNYSLEWDTESTLIYDLMMRAPGLMGDAVGLQTSQSTDKQTTTEAISQATLGAGKALQAGGISAATGMASNSKKEQIFKGVNFRSFGMRYTFHPKDVGEARTVQNIIQTFKYHMMPEYYSANQFTFIYPSEFDITFFTDYGYENEWVCKIGTCVLTDMAVNYTPDGVWAVHDGGVPNVIQISLSFKELGIITKEAIEQGF